MTEFAWEMISDAKTGRYRCDLVEIEPDLVLFQGPLRKSREAAFRAARKTLDRMFAEAGFNCWGPEPGQSV